MRRLIPPTLEQWGCAHQWKEQSTEVQGDKLHRTRYYFCRRCELRVKTREVPEVPWTEQDQVELVIGLLPEGQLVYLRDRGIAELPPAGLNAILARHGLEIHASRGRDLKRLVACTDQDGRVKSFGLFELRRTSLEGLAPRSAAPGAEGTALSGDDLGGERRGFWRFCHYLGDRGQDLREEKGGNDGRVQETRGLLD